VYKNAKIAGDDGSSNWRKAYHTSGLVEYYSMSSNRAVQPELVGEEGAPDNSLTAVTATTVMFPAYGDPNSDSDDEPDAAPNCSTTDDEYKGRFLAITGGTGSGQVREVVSYDGSTRTATVSTWETNPDSTSTWRLLNGASVKSFVLEPAHGHVFNDTELKHLFLYPGESVVVESRPESRASTVTASVSWHEYF
jgi:hypothetical protein